MELKDAIDVLGMVEAHNPLVSKAKEKAICSLKAWDEIIEEFEIKCDGKARHCANCAFCSYEFELRDILRIIQEHLAIGLLEEE